MSGIFNGIQAILDTMLAPIKYLGYIIEEIITFFTLIKTIVINIVIQIGTLPSYITNYLLLSFSILTVITLIGRKAGE